MDDTKRAHGQFGFAINIPDEEVHRRLANRRMCKSCGASYHLILVPTKEEGVCDGCGGELYQRGLDTAEKVQPRIDGYHEWTLPMLSYLEEKGFTIVHIDGMMKPSDVSTSITNTLRDKGFVRSNSSEPQTANEFGCRIKRLLSGKLVVTIPMQLDP